YAALFLNHSYGRPVIGWRHEIEQLDREDALAFYRRFSTPNNAILVVAGDVTPEEVRALASETFANVTRVAEVKTRRPSTEPPHAAAVETVIADVIANVVTGEELERAKSRIIADAVYANDNQRAMAQWYGAALATAATVQQVRSWPDRIRETAAEAVRDAAHRWLDKRRSVTGHLV